MAEQVLRFPGRLAAFDESMLGFGILPRRRGAASHHVKANFEIRI